MKIQKNIKPSLRGFRSFYVSVMLWFVGRALQGISHIDDEVQKELQENFPEGVVIAMGVEPLASGEVKMPALYVKKVGGRFLKFLGCCPPAEVPQLTISFKSLAAAMRVFTFQEKTTEAQAYDRFITDGPLTPALAFVRILNRVEITLLPRFIAQKAVRRYEKLPHKHLNRIRLYIKTLFPTKEVL